MVKPKGARKIPRVRLFLSPFETSVLMYQIIRSQIAEDRKISKANLNLKQAIKTQRENRGIALFFP